VSILAKMISELMQGVPRDSLRTGSVEVPVQERHHPMPLCCLEQIRPLYPTLKQ
jgi:hypothetical protein